MSNRNPKTDWNLFCHLSPGVGVEGMVERFTIKTMKGIIEQAVSKGYAPPSINISGSKRDQAYRLVGIRKEMVRQEGERRKQDIAKVELEERRKGTAWIVTHLGGGVSFTLHVNEDGEEVVIPLSKENAMSLLKPILECAGLI